MHRTKKRKPEDQIIAGGLAPPERQNSEPDRRHAGAGDEAHLASNVRLMAERLGMMSVELRRHGMPLVLSHDRDHSGTYRSSEIIDSNALLDIHEQLRAALVTRQALDHDVLNRVRGTHAIRRRRDAEWYAAQRTKSR